MSANTRRTRQACEACYVYKAGVAKARWRAHVVDVLEEGALCAASTSQAKEKKRRSTLVGIIATVAVASELENKIDTLCGLLDATIVEGGDTLVPMAG